MFQVINGALLGVLIFGAAGAAVAFSVRPDSAAGLSVYPIDPNAASIIYMLRWLCTFVSGGAGGIMGAVIGATAASTHTKPLTSSEKAIALAEILLIIGVMVVSIAVWFGSG